MDNWLMPRLSESDKCHKVAHADHFAEAHPGIIKRVRSECHDVRLKAKAAEHDSTLSHKTVDGIKQPRSFPAYMMPTACTTTP
jgi:hypothetical protein